MLQRPSVTVVGVPPWARTMPAARLLAPSPTRPRSTTMTRSAPEVRAKYDAHPPIVPAPTITRSARSAAISRPIIPSPAPGGGSGWGPPRHQLTTTVGAHVSHFGRASRAEGAFVAADSCVLIWAERRAALLAASLLQHRCQLSPVSGVELVGEELRRVVLPLEREERIHPRVRALQLVGSIVQLIRQIEGPALLSRGVDQQGGTFY